MKKLLLLAIGLLVLGAAAIGFGVYTFSDVSRYERYAADDRAKAVAAEAKEATRTRLEQAIPGPPLSATYRQSMVYNARTAEELRIVGWSFIGGAVVLVGAGALVLFAHHRRANRTTADPAATQVIYRQGSAGSR